MRDVFRQLRRYAACERPVLLEGETGTGKTILARYLHDCSPRAGRIFSEYSLASPDDSLAADSLFGHLNGAFTGAVKARLGLFQASQGGTLFLDELGKASLSIQGKLLTAVERRIIYPLGSDRPVRVDVRVIVASNVPLADLAKIGAFLPDLVMRLEPLRVTIPPLRDRRADILLFADHFLERLSPEHGYAHPPRLHPALADALRLAPWPGNLRQLEGAIYRLMADARPSPVIGLEHCTGHLTDLAGRQRRPPLTVADVCDALAKTDSKTAAAQALGVSRGGLHWFCKENGIEISSTHSKLARMADAPPNEPEQSVT
jgi:DNA-binding NtrC family response regulator